MFDTQRVAASMVFIAVYVVCTYSINKRLESENTSARVRWSLCMRMRTAQYHTLAGLFASTEMSTINWINSLAVVRSLGGKLSTWQHKLHACVRRYMLCQRMRICRAIAMRLLVIWKHTVMNSDSRLCVDDVSLLPFRRYVQAQVIASFGIEVYTNDQVRKISHNALFNGRWKGGGVAVQKTYTIYTFSQRHSPEGCFSCEVFTGLVA